MAISSVPSSLTDPVLAEQHAAADLDSRALESLTEEVCRSGLAVTRGGVVPGVASIAAPVFTNGDTLPLAVSVVLPTREATDSEVDKASLMLLDATRVMSRELGSARG